MESGHAQPIVTEPDDEHALVPYTGEYTDHDDSFIEDEADHHQQKKPGFLSRVKSKIKGGASAIRNKFKGKSSSGSTDHLDHDPDMDGALVPYDGDNQDQLDDDDFDKPLQTTRPSRGGYNPYGTSDDLNYSQGYGYNGNTGNYNPYGQSYGYNPYGGSSTTHEESDPMYLYPPMGGEVFHSDGDNQGANAGAAAMAAFGSVLAGLLQQPAATAPAQPAQPAPAPAPQPVTPQSVAPQDDGDLDDLYGGSGDYAPTTGSSSSSYGSSSSSFGSTYRSPSSSSYGSSSYGSRGSSYGSSSYGSSPSNSGYSSYGDGDWD